MMPQNYPGIGLRQQPDYLSTYYGTSNRSPSSNGHGSYGGVGVGAQFSTFPQSGFSNSPIQFGNDFMSNSNSMNSSQIMRVPSYSRNMVTGTPFQL
ncbi:MAG: hypothetical protein HN576_03575 [Bacteriovoracaceae bacterium]|nr:hypothetical protein [Bacteriovoracaceae bacterium]